jgi:hypothetical protein
MRSTPRLSLDVSSGPENFVSFYSEILLSDFERGAQVVLTLVLEFRPSHVQGHVMPTIKRHNTIEKRVLSTEMQSVLSSLWTYQESRELCAFQWQG